MNREFVEWKRGKFSLVRTVGMGWGNREYEKFLVMHEDLGMLGNALWFLPVGKSHESVVKAKVGVMKRGTAQRISTYKRKIETMEERMRILNQF